MPVKSAVPMKVNGWLPGRFTLASSVGLMMSPSAWLKSMTQSASDTEAVVEGKGIGAGAAGQRVLVDAAIEVVVAQPAPQDVLVSAAEHPVIVIAAVELVVAGIAPEGVFAVVAIDGVVAIAGEELVVPAIAGQRIAAVFAADLIGAVVADQPIVMVRALQILDPRERVALGVAAIAVAGDQGYGNARAGGDV